MRGRNARKKRRDDESKRELAARFAKDRDGYTRAKDGFVREVLRKANKC